MRLSESEVERLAKLSPIVRVQGQQWRDRMADDAVIGIRRWPIPPVHSLDVHLHALGEPRQQLPVADFPAAMAVRVNNLTDKRDNGAACQTNSALYGRQAI